MPVAHGYPRVGARYTPPAGTRSDGGPDEGTRGSQLPEPTPAGKGHGHSNYFPY